MASQTQPDCTCGDGDVQILHELVEAGHDQREVSHLLWGDPSRASPATTLAFTSRDTRRWVRQAFQAAFPWLRLPGGVA
jgi:hypothetical protein